MHNSVADSETESSLELEDENVSVEVVKAWAAGTVPLPQHDIAVVFLGVATANVPSKANTPNRHTCVQDPRAKINLEIIGEH